VADESKDLHFLSDLFRFVILSAFFRFVILSDPDPESASADEGEGESKDLRSLFAALRTMLRAPSFSRCRRGDRKGWGTSNPVPNSI
jgi:hypothetical protein